MSKLGPYLKAIMGLLGAILTSLASFYGGQHWFVIVMSVFTAVSVYLVPNTPKPASPKPGE
jgi:uncharacterized membrane protein (DUF4010 family)